MTSAEWNALTNPLAMLDCLLPDNGHPMTSERKLTLYADAAACAACKRLIPTDSSPAEQATYIAGASCGTMVAKAEILRDIVGDPWRPVYWTDDPKRHAEPSPRATPHPSTVPHLALRRTWVTPEVLAIANAAYDERDWTLLPVLADALIEAGTPEEEWEVVTVTAGTRCPVCGGKGWWRAGVEFEHMRKCTSCDARAWVPDAEYSFRRKAHHRLLAHLRKPGPIFRGHWSLDLVLGKE